MQKSLIAIVAGLSLTLLPTLSSSAETYRAPMNSVPSGYLGIHIVDQVYWGEGASALIADLGRGTGNGDAILCEGQTGIPCDFASLKATDIRANLIMPKCADELEVNCIESLSVYKAGSNPVPAKFIREVGGSTTLPDHKLLLSRGGTPSLWDAEGVVNAGGTTTYSVMGQLKLARCSTDEPFKASSLSLTVMPYVETSTPYSRPITWTQMTRSDQTHQVGSTGGTPDCAWVDTNRCGLIQDYSEDTRVKIGIRLTKQIGGWFKGRMQGPEISISNFNATTNSVNLDGQYSKVPQFFTLLDRANGPANLKTLVGLDRGQHQQGPGGGGTTSTMSDQGTAFEWVDKFRGLAKDTAAGLSTVWSAGTIQGSQGNCLADTSRLLGIVSTNSMVYEGQSPSFDGKSLAYKVAGMHYLPGGEQAVEGTYDLVMRSDVARCLYGFSKAPVSATIQVTGEGGESKVATTIVNETADGWLKLAAYGFTFSAPTISVQLSQAKTPVAKKTTITCVSIKNKKLTKKVTAVGPKCPAGYKKK